MTQIHSSGKSTLAPLPKTQPGSPTATRSLFDPKLSSAIEITDTNSGEAKELLAQKVTEGWRWISKGFIDDSEYDTDRGYFTSYRVKSRHKEPDQSDFHNADIVLMKEPYKDAETGKKRKEFFYLDKDGEIQNGNCSAKWRSQQLQEYFNNHLTDFELPSNPVLEARQMPELEEGDWVVTQGKTLRLIKADHPIIAKLEQQTHTVSEGDVEGVTLAANFFKDNYVRLAGAYVRHLERLTALEQAFETFFDVEEIQQSVKVRLATGRQDPRTKKWVTAYRSCGDYTSYHKVTLSDKKLTLADLTLVKEALGITIDPDTINKKSTIGNTIPFKKVLEILTFYNKHYNAPNNVPILVSLPISTSGGGRTVDFLLNAEVGNPNQLIISREEDSQKGTYTGNAYPFWVGNATYAPSAGLADSVLNQPLEQSKEQIRKLGDIRKIRNLIEFLACTQIVEAHATPGELERSRVPGSGKHARSIISHAKDSGKPLSHYFASKNLATSTEFYPMAATKGTPNGRNAVNTLNRTNNQVTGKDQHRTVTATLDRKVSNNAPDYDMSEDSEVES